MWSPNLTRKTRSCLIYLSLTKFYRALSAAWQKQVSRPKGLTEADVRERKPADPSLICPIDNRLFRDAVKTPCCERAYCEECIQTYLLENDFICDNCQKKITSLDKLMVNKPLRTRVGDYIDKVIEESRKEAEASGTSGTLTQSISAAEAEQVRFTGFWGICRVTESLVAQGTFNESGGRRQ